MHALRVCVNGQSYRSSGDWYQFLQNQILVVLSVRSKYVSLKTKKNYNENIELYFCPADNGVIDF